MDKWIPQTGNCESVFSYSWLKVKLKNTLIFCDSDARGSIGFMLLTFLSLQFSGKKFHFGLKIGCVISRPIFKQLCFLFSASKEMFVQTMSRVSTFSKFSTLSICSKVLPREQSRNQLKRGMMWVTSHGGRVFAPYPNTLGLNLGLADNCDWTHWALRHELESRNFGLNRKQEPSWFLRLEL